jgi:hypothetical protein
MATQRYKIIPPQVIRIVLPFSFAQSLGPNTCKKTHPGFAAWLKAS